MDKTPPPLEGYFRSLLKTWAYIKIAGDRVGYHETGKDVWDNIKMEQGEFSLAAENIREMSGKEKYNLKMVIFFDDNKPEMKFEKLGVLSDDRERMIFMNTSDKGRFY